MRRGVGLGALLLLAGCDSAKPVQSGNNDVAIATAERQAVGDTDAALKEAQASQPSGTNVSDDRSSR